MSAYIVDDSTVNRILAYLMHKEGYVARQLVTDHSTDASLPGLGQAMRDLNVAAVSARYPDDSLDNLPGPCPLLPYAFEEELPPNPIAAYKSLSCFLYQCAEGYVPETPLYKALEDLRARIAGDIISSLPAYETAAWG